MFYQRAHYEFNIVQYNGKVLWFFFRVGSDLAVICTLERVQPNLHVNDALSYVNISSLVLNKKTIFQKYSSSHRAVVSVRLSARSNTTNGSRTTGD